MCCVHFHGCDSYVERPNISTPSFPEEVRGLIKNGFCCLLPFRCLLPSSLSTPTDQHPTSWKCGHEYRVQCTQWLFSQGFQEHLRPWVKTLPFSPANATGVTCPGSLTASVLAQHCSPAGRPQRQPSSSASESPLYGHGLFKKVYPYTHPCRATHLGKQT